MEDVRAYKDTDTCFAFGDALHVTFKNAVQNDVIEYLHSKGHDDVEMEVIKPTIEDCFIRLLKG